MLRTRITGLLLAGGQGSRLAKDKGWRPVGGTPIVMRALRALTLVAEETIVVGDCALPPMEDVRQVRDEAPDAGPLAAILTGMRRAAADLYVVVAWDMPFVTPDLLRHLISECHAVDAVVPTLAARDQPLCAVYAQTCLSPIAETLARGTTKVAGFFPMVRVKRPAEAELRRFGEPNKLFLNVNTAEDLAVAEGLAGEE